DSHRGVKAEYRLSHQETTAIGSDRQPNSLSDELDPLVRLLWHDDLHLVTTHDIHCPSLNHLVVGGLATTLACEPFSCGCVLDVFHSLVVREQGLAEPDGTVLR